jgi:hypothetical protein
MDNKKRRFTYGAQRRYKLKKTADNEFTALTGIKAFRMIGGSNCVIVRSKTVKGIKPCRFAYRKYNGMDNKGAYIEMSELVEIHTICGVLNCVGKEHIVAKYKPCKEDIEYIQSYHKVNSLSEMSHFMKVPIQIYTVWYNMWHEESSTN